MFRYIAPTILIAIAITGFVMFTNPIFTGITNVKNEIASYNEALDNAKTLENERDKLTQKYNAIDPVNLDKLQKFLPDNVDNIRLILEIEKLASPYGMVLKDVKYDSAVLDQSGATTSTATSPQVSNAIGNPEDNKNYGTWNLEFSTEGTYSNFIDLVKDLENNLRVVDISSVAFSSDGTNVVLGKAKPTDTYKYDFKIKTYWLKN